MWRAFSQQEKDKYKEGLTPLPASGRGGTHAWARTSTLTEATSTADDALVIARDAVADAGVHMVLNLGKRELPVTALVQLLHNLLHFLVQSFQFLW